ncbi:MAG: adenylate kinase family protein [Verrucomicrobiales bacterium]
MAAAPLVILFGPPASGKGTQARMLHERFGWRAFSTGAAIRSHVERNTPFGKRCQDLLGSAYLLPDDFILELVRSELESVDGGLVLDGFPRTVRQAELFDELCRERGWKIDAVIALVATEEELAERIMHRLTCTACGGTFRNGDLGAPVEGGACPLCGAMVGRRKDDHPDVFAERFAEYKKLTLPLLDYYAPRGIVREFHALLPSSDMARQITDLFPSLS